VPEAVGTWAEGINNAAQVIGYFFDNTVDASGVNGSHGFLLTAERVESSTSLNPETW